MTAVDSSSSAVIYVDSTYIQYTWYIFGGGYVGGGYVVGSRYFTSQWQTQAITNRPPQIVCA